MAYLDQFLHHALGRRASDVHFSSDEPVRLRIDGDLVAMDENVLTSEQITGLMMEILSDEEKAKFEKQKNLDKSYMVEGLANFRLNIFWTRKGMSCVIRQIPSRIPTMEELGLPASIQDMTELPKGLVLVTGPTGSGKSTTLAAMINHINTHHPYHILTVEDPVEFVHPSKQSLVNQREIGTNCHSFSDALKYALREDPDVILVGEMRDLETIGLALTAAETGHLVFGTLHTRGAAASVDRIIDSFPANQQAMVRAMLSESLMGVVSQALFKKKNGPGRVAAYEIMAANHAISNLIREGKTFQIASIIQTGKKDGMMLMAQHIRELITQDLISEEEAAAFLDEGSGHSKPKATVAKAAPTPPKTANAATNALKPTAAFVPKFLDKDGAGAKAGAPTATAAAKPAATAPTALKPSVVSAVPPAQPRPAPVIAAKPTSVIPGGANTIKPPPMKPGATGSTPAAAAAPTAAPAATPVLNSGLKAAPASAFPSLNAPAKTAAVRPAPPAAPVTVKVPVAPAAPSAPPGVETDLSAYADSNTNSSIELSDGVLEVKLGDEDALHEMAESTGTHEVTQQRTTNPPSAPGVKPAPPFKKVG